MKIKQIYFITGLALICGLSASGYGQISTNSFARDGRFIRGSGTNPNFHSFVIALDGQKGVPLDDMGDNLSKFGGQKPWVSRISRPTQYHYDATLNNYSRSFVNPIVAFGGSVGGSSLYVGQSYRFGVFAGKYLPTDVNTIRIQAYQKAGLDNPSSSNISPVGTSYMTLPNRSNAAEWRTFSENGFSKSLVVKGMTTRVQFVEPGDPSDEKGIDRWGVTVDSPFILTHTGDSTSKSYYFQISLLGSYTTSASQTFPMVYSNVSAHTTGYSSMYVLGFEDLPPWRSSFIDMPHFEGKPLPPFYAGKSVDELLKVAQPPINGPPSVSPSNPELTLLNASPELNQHPILDEFVEEMGRDPISLANYVFNEIELTDAITEKFKKPTETNVALAMQGLNRDALAVFQEKQGSPVEQCALLVYLLRKSGYPAAYMFPESGGLQVLSSRMSKVLRVQLDGAVNEKGDLEVPRLLSVNFPWVATYVNGQWIHLFPWLKDTEIREGLNLYDYMPEAYNSPLKWVRKYLLKDLNIMGLGSKDLPSVLFPAHVQKSLSEKFKNIKMEDIGMKVLDRKIYRTKWSDFPSPWSVPSGGNWWYSSLNGLGIDIREERNSPFNKIYLNILALDSNYHPTGKHIQTPLFNVMELHNRRMLIRHEKLSSTSHKLIFTIAPYRTGLSDLTDRLSAKRYEMTLNEADQNIRVQYVLSNRMSDDRTAAEKTTNPFPWKFFETTTESRSADIKKGDLAAICMDVGRVSGDMLRVHAEERWAMERGINDGSITNPDPDVKIGTPAYMMGMNYYSKCDRFREEILRLHKNVKVSSFGMGLSKILAARDAQGNLPNGDINLNQPAVDMFTTDFYYTRAFKDDTHWENGETRDPSRNAFAIDFAENSAQEHEIINEFYSQTEAISTVKLLHRSSNGPIELTKANYVTEMSKSYSNGVVSKPLKDWDKNIWNSIVAAFTRNPDYTRVFVTRGLVSNAEGSYKGLGAFILEPGHQGAALISGKYNGGVGQTFVERLFGGFIAYCVESIFGDTVCRMVDTNVSWDELRSLIERTPLTDVQRRYIILGAIPDVGVSFGSLSSQLTSTQEEGLRAQLEMERSGPISEDTVIYASDLTERVLSQIPDSTIHVVKDKFQNLADPVNLVSGEFYIDAIDLKLDGPMPLEVRRNYTSFNLANGGGLGYGWKPCYVPTLVFKDGNNVVYASDADGSTICYTNSVANPYVWVPTWENNPSLHNVNDGMIGSTGNTINNRIVKVFGTPGTPGTPGVRQAPGISHQYKFYESGGRVRTFEEMTIDRSGQGTNVVTVPALVKWEDASGNNFEFAYGSDRTKSSYGRVIKIQSSNGTNLRLKYDAYERIVEILSSDGRRVLYDYDQEGDLRRVRLSDGAEINYDYGTDSKVVNGKTLVSSNHLILKEKKADGNILVNTYDVHRRCLTQQAPVGLDEQLVKNATFTYNNVNGNTTAKDALDQVTTYSYNENGLITEISDPIPGGTTRRVSQEWYGTSETSGGAYPRSLKKMTDARGLVTEFKYDSKGNVIEKKVTGELDGDLSTVDAPIFYRYEFNALNLMTKETDPSGKYVKHYFDDPNHPYLETSSEIWSSGGELISSSKNEYQNVNEGGNKVFGVLRKSTIAEESPNPAITEFEYNGRGNITKKTQYSRTSDPNLVLQLRYNPRGEPVEILNSLGQKTVYDYDAMGRRIFNEVYDENGKLVSWKYDYFDGNGKLVWSDGPQYNPEDYLWSKYDGAGRLREAIRWRSEATEDGHGLKEPEGDDLYATMFYNYDKVNNLTEVKDTRGNLTAMTYDVLGRKLTQKTYQGSSADLSSLLKSEAWTYEPGGEVTDYTNPLGGVVSKLYTSRGSLRKQTNPDGSVLEWRYDPDGRMKKAILSNKNYVEYTYDDGIRTTTQTLRKSDGTILASEVEVRDALGNVISKTDREGNVFLSKYDALGRIKESTGSLSTDRTKQQKTVYTYDETGRVTIMENLLGEKSIVTKDVLGREIESKVLSKNGQVIRKTSYEYSPEFHKKTTILGGDVQTRLIQYLDESGRVVSTVKGDGSTTIQKYDSAGNMLSSKDEIGNLTRYTFDGLNRTKTQTLPDGALTTFNYDGAGNMLERILPDGSKWVAVYDNASRILSEKQTQGTTTRRNYAYTYYPSTSSLVGLLNQMTDPKSNVFTYSYDDFLRKNQVTIAKKSGNTTIPVGPDLTFGYDRRGKITRVEQTYPNTQDGPPTRVEMSYDTYGQLLNQSVYMDGDLMSRMEQSWDEAGRRISLNSNRSTILSTAANTPPLFNFSYDAGGAMSKVAVNRKNYQFNYDQRGLLSSVNTPFKTEVLSRDVLGLISGKDTYWNDLNGSSPKILSETLTRRRDQKISTYQASPLISGNMLPEIPSRQSMSYTYNDRGQLTQESNNPSTGRSTTTQYGFDSAKMGIRDFAVQSSGEDEKFRVENETKDTFGAVTREGQAKEEASHFVATGKAEGALSVDVKLDGRPLVVEGYRGQTGDGTWNANVDTRSGTHTLEATARHPNGGPSSSSTSTFKVELGNQTVNILYDSEGNVTNRVWSSGVKQSLFWDGKNRLTRMTERNGSNNGWNWRAVYDGMGRRLQTQYEKVVGNAVSGGVSRVDSFFDPLVEFLEVGFVNNGELFWKVYGPDLSGGYGGFQGVGGIQALVRDRTGVALGMVNDLQGNVVGTTVKSSLEKTGVGWNPVSVNGYGPIPGVDVPPREALNPTLELDSGKYFSWQGRSMDPTGLYNLGARFYDPEQGSLLELDSKAENKIENIR